VEDTEKAEASNEVTGVIPASQLGVPSVQPVAITAAGVPRTRRAVRHPAGVLPPHQADRKVTTVVRRGTVGVAVDTVRAVEAALHTMVRAIMQEGEVTAPVAHQHPEDMDLCQHLLPEVMVHPRVLRMEGAVQERRKGRILHQTMPLPISTPEVQVLMEVLAAHLVLMADKVADMDGER